MATEKYTNDLIRLWNEGMPCSAIGVELTRLGHGVTGEAKCISKNAVVGMRARIEKKNPGCMPARPTPIVRYEQDTKRPVKPQPAKKISADTKTLVLLVSDTVLPPLVAREEWQGWFNRLPMYRRRELSCALHVSNCPLIAGGQLWRCTCGSTLPPARQIAASDHPGISEPNWGAPPPIGEPPGDDDGEGDDGNDDGEDDPITDDGTENSGNEDGEDIVDDCAPPATRPAKDHGSRRSSMTCCWPIGEPGTKTFRFCDANSLPGKPYCDEHAKLSFVKIRDRKEDYGKGLSK